MKTVEMASSLRNGGLCLGWCWNFLYVFPRLGGGGGGGGLGVWCGVWGGMGQGAAFKVQHEYHKQLTEICLSNPIAQFGKCSNPVKNVNRS